MECDGLKLFESGAIVHDIAERSPALMPEDPREVAVTAWMFGALNSIERKRFVRAAWRRSVLFDAV